MSAISEIDPLFIKALGFLHSKSAESTQQLQALVDSYREKIYGSGCVTKVEANYNAEGKSPKLDIKPKASLARQNSPVVFSPKPDGGTNCSSPSSSGESSKLGADDSSSLPGAAVEEVLTSSLADALSYVSNIGEVHMIESDEESNGHSFEPIAKKHRLDCEVDTNDLVDGLAPSSEVGDAIPVDDPVKVGDGDPTCAACNRCAIEINNSVIECQECHSHFHQLCHKPPVSTKDVNDPRLVWYCSKCTRKMSKAREVRQLGAPALAMKGKPEGIGLGKSINNPFQQLKSGAQPFRRQVQLATPDRGQMADVGKPMPDLLRQQAAFEKVASIAPAAPVSPSSPSLLSGMEAGQSSPKSLPQSIALKSFKRLELVKKRARHQQQLKARR